MKNTSKFRFNGTPLSKKENCKLAKYENEKTKIGIIHTNKIGCHCS